MTSSQNAAAAVVAPSRTSDAQRFDFEHKVFSLASCVFRKAHDGSCIVLQCPLGDVVAALPIQTLCATFEIAPGSNDAALLKRVAEALKYVKQVRPGDSVPSEILDGRAS